MLQIGHTQNSHTYLNICRKTINQYPKPQKSTSNPMSMKSNNSIQKNSNWKQFLYTFQIPSKSFLKNIIFITHTNTPNYVENLLVRLPTKWFLLPLQMQKPPSFCALPKQRRDIYYQLSYLEILKQNERQLIMHQTNCIHDGDWGNLCDKKTDKHVHVQ